MPRMRVDRLMNFAWKYLVPLSIVNIIVSAIWFECVIRPGILTLGNWAFGTAVTAPIIVAAIWMVFWINRKESRASQLGSDWPRVGSMRPASLRTTGR